MLPAGPLVIVMVSGGAGCTKRDPIQSAIASRTTNGTSVAARSRHEIRVILKMEAKPVDCSCYERRHTDHRRPGGYLDAMHRKFRLAATLGVLAAVAGCDGGSGGKDLVATVTPPPAVTPVYVCGGETFASATFSTGSINGQEGWFADPSAGFDEGIVSLGSSACRGKGVWKLNNSVTSSSFGNQPQSPAFPESAGESSVRSAGGGDTMAVSFFFRTVSSTAVVSLTVRRPSPTSSDPTSWTWSSGASRTTTSASPSRRT